MRIARIAVFSTAVAVLVAACAATTPTPSTVPEKYREVPLLEKGGPITPPRTIKRVEPMAPRELRASTSSATATAEVVVDTNGNVVDAWYSEGDRQWADVFIKALQGWKFTPATLNGEPIMVRIKLSSSFRSNM